MNTAICLSSPNCITPRTSAPTLRRTSRLRLACFARSAVRAGPLQAASAITRRPSVAVFQQVKPYAATLAALLPLLAPLPASAFEAAIRHSDPGVLAMPWLSITFGAILFSAAAPRQLGFVDGSPALGGIQDIQAAWKKSVSAQPRVTVAEPAVTEDAAAEPTEAEDLSLAADTTPQAVLAFKEDEEESAAAEDYATLTSAAEDVAPLAIAAEDNSTLAKATEDPLAEEEEVLPAAAPVFAFSEEQPAEADVAQISEPLAFLEEADQEKVEDLVMEYAGPDAGQPVVAEQPVEAAPVLAAAAEPVTPPVPVAPTPSVSATPAFAATSETVPSGPQPEKMQEEYEAKVAQLKELAAKKEQQDSRRWQARSNEVEHIRSTAQTMREVTTKQSKARGFNPKAVLAGVFEALLAAWTRIMAALKGVTGNNLLSGRPAPKRISDKPQFGGAV